MMASKPLKSLFRGAGRNALDLPVAGLAALATAFAAFAVPQDLLSSAVNATGLPAILSAAQPPLGLTARVALAVGGALIVFGLVFLLLRLLDRSGLNDAADARDEGESLSPRVRRRDGHPDAPAPRPISAARDLGEPAPPAAPRVPLWLDEAEPVAAPAVEAQPAPEPQPEPVIEPVAALAPAVVPDPVIALPPEPEAVVEPRPWPEPAPVAEAEPGPDPEPDPEPQAEPRPRPATSIEMPTSIAELMARLEQGLAKRQTTAPAPAAPVATPQVFPAAPEAPDDRLQSAIASLQRLAARSS